MQTKGQKIQFGFQCGEYSIGCTVSLLVRVGVANGKASQFQVRDRLRDQFVDQERNVHASITFAGDVKVAVLVSRVQCQEFLEEFARSSGYDIVVVVGCIEQWLTEPDTGRRVQKHHVGLAVPRIRVALDSQVTLNNKRAQFGEKAAER